MHARLRPRTPAPPRRPAASGPAPGAAASARHARRSEACWNDSVSMTSM